MVKIIMATYNGEKYLDAQIQSIVQQDYNEWELYISDDVSTDGTLAIINRYVLKYPQKIFLVSNEFHYGNPASHFWSIMGKIGYADYIMFSDQDDVWHSDKISKTLEEMKKVEYLQGGQTPILIHTDLRVVDEKLNCIKSSFFEMVGLDETRNKLNNLLIENIVTGCTIMINLSLFLLSKDVVYPRDDRFAFLHDRCLALIAASEGYIGFVNEATIDYRQHSNNCVGASEKQTILNYFSRFFKQGMHVKQNMMKSFEQASLFYDSFQGILSKSAKSIILEYCELLSTNKMNRVKVYLKKRYLKQGFIPVALQLLFG